MKKYHKWYRDDPDLVIDESNLPWMGDREECDLSTSMVEMTESTTSISGRPNDAPGSAVCPLYEHDESEKKGALILRTECLSVKTETMDRTDRLLIKLLQTEFVGTVNDSTRPLHNDEDRYIIDELSSVCKSNTSNEQQILSFPSVTDKAEDEYNGLPIFSNAFPWLFPGGVGDIDSINKQEQNYVSRWLSSMMRYFDGRFWTDVSFCFYGLNYLQRHLNTVSGGFFVNGFIKDSRPANLEELKDQLIRQAAILF